MVVIGVDAAFANMGLTRARLDIDFISGQVKIDCLDLKLVSTGGEDRKVVRKSSDDLRRAKELQKALTSYAAGASFAFVEVPTGSQSAAAARSLGIAVGVLASCPIPIIEVSPMEVKIAVSGDRKIQATKEAVITWAVHKWPAAPWLRVKGGRITKNNEHLADALATIAAGVVTPEFRQLITMYHASSSPAHLRPASRRRLLV
jgi:hypothetical protein